MKLAIIDTNVVVAGLLSTEATSPPRRILDAMLAGRIPFLLSEALLVEHRAVQLRDTIRRRHGLDELEIDRLLTAIVTNAMIREPTPRRGAPDANDDHLWALALDEPQATLVTGDAALMAALSGAATVATPRSLVEASEPG